MLPYRDCVVAVIQRPDGCVFAGQRSDRDNVWQLPQGGVEPGESPEQAVRRELLEEIGTASVETIMVCNEPIFYDFPPGMQAPIAKQFRGQKQVWFLLKFTQAARPDLSNSDGEFKALDWREPSVLLAGVVEWKKTAYERGFAAFNLC